jgi:hypothetical protein
LTGYGEIGGFMKCFWADMFYDMKECGVHNPPFYWMLGFIGGAGLFGLTAVSIFMR